MGLIRKFDTWLARRNTRPAPMSQASMKYVFSPGSGGFTIDIAPSTDMNRLSHEETTVQKLNAQTAAAILTTTIPANTILATGAIDWNVYGALTVGGGEQVGFGITFGGSAVFTGTSNNLNDYTCRWHIRLKIVNTATNAQRCLLEIFQEPAKGTKSDIIAEYTALTINTTSAQDLALTWSTNGGAVTFNKYFSDVILLP